MDEKYCHVFSNEVNVIRSYPYPWSKIGRSVLLFRIPFFHRFVFANELLWFFVCVVTSGIVYAMNGLVILWPTLLTSSFILYVILTKCLLDIRIVLSGERVSGKVEQIVSYENSGGDNKEKYLVRTNWNMEFWIDEVNPNSLTKGQIVDLLVIEGAIPYAIRRGQVALWSVFYFVIYFWCIRFIDISL